MKKNDIFTGETPIYMQLYERLKEDIVGGVYQYGRKLPSKRVIADRYAISLITVEHTLALLAEEGYIESRERSGYFVVFKEEEVFTVIGADKRSDVAKASYEEGQNYEGQVLRGQSLEGRIQEGRAQEGRAQGEEVAGVRSRQAQGRLKAERPSVDALSAELFPFSVYARTMRSVISDYAERIMDPVPNTGSRELKQAICDYLARSRGMRVGVERLVIGSGSEYLYGLIVQLFGQDKIYAIEKPGYEKIEMVYRANGAVPELLPLGDNGITSEALRRSHAKILHITPYRSYPTGISTDASKRREYIRWANDREAYIVEDDFESEFTPSSKPEETVFSLATRDNVLYLNSFSKTIAASIRISYLILPETLVGEFEEKLGFYKCTVPGYDQYVLARFINSGEFERHLNRVRRRLRG